MNAGKSVLVTLPGGCWQAGSNNREARLRPLNGEDESFLLETVEALLPAERTTAVLTRCLTCLGSEQRVTEPAVRALTVGDREALLLHLRRITFGERMPCLLTCPDPACGEKMDLDLNASELMLTPYADVQELHESEFAADGVRYRLRFRLPTGGDQEAAAHMARVDPRRGADLLLRRCVEQVLTEGAETLPVQALPPAVVTQVGAKMVELDPQAETLLDIACPACGQHFSALFDAAAYLFQELAGRIENLYREVHVLALHYHWSEADILGLTARKRRRYLDLLQGARNE
jgi:hypothetical protein